MAVFGLGACQKLHWKCGHKVDCIDPQTFSENFSHVDRLSEAIRANCPPEQYEERRRQFIEALAQAVREVGLPEPPRYQGGKEERKKPSYSTVMNYSS